MNKSIATVGMQRVVSLLLPLLFIAFLSVAEGHKNVYGDDLQACSANEVSRNGTHLSCMNDTIFTTVRETNREIGCH
jgi:hypothetical protein